MKLIGSFGFFSSLQCNVCVMLPEDKGDTSRNIDKNTMTCARCQLIRYCDKEHQVKDWPNHRDFCQAVKRILNKTHKKHPLLIMGDLKCDKDLEEAVLGLKFLLRNELNRKLNFNEEQLTSFPSYCMVCYSVRTVQYCKKCFAVAYCSKDHASKHEEEHSKVCNLLSLYYCPYKVKDIEWNTNIHVRKRVDNLKDTDLYGAFQSATEKMLPENPTTSLYNYQAYSAAADFSCIATICFVMEFLNMPAYKSNKFVIYVVGATIEQSMWFREEHTKFFFSQYPKITKLHLHFIGPEVVGEPERTLNFVFDHVQRQVVFESFIGFFQNYCERQRINPSMIVAFNCGFSEYAPPPAFQVDEEGRTTTEITIDTWSQGLMEILRTYTVPIVFTSFTDLEAQFDFAAVLRVAQSDNIPIDVNRILSFTKNPYRDFRPLRNIYIADKEQIYYRNGYVQVIQTCLKS